MAASTNIYGFNIGGNNNSFDQRGHFYRGVFSGNVTGMLVKQNSTPNMTVLVEHGSALLNKNTTSASIAEIKADTSVTIDTANTSNPRIDTVVIYEDTSITIPTIEANYWQDGAGGRFKLVSLPGTAAASPVALSDANIQTAIGAGKPWTRLADITVPTNSTTIINSNISDKRVIITPSTISIPDGGVGPSKLSQYSWNYSIAAISYSAVIAGTWSRLATTGTGGLSVTTALSSGSQNDEVQYRIVLAAGTYTVLIHYDKDTNRGIYTVVADGVTLGTSDSYSATRVAGTVSQITNSYNVTTGKLVDLRVRMASKNAASAAYYASFYDIQVIRTS